MQSPVRQKQKKLRQYLAFEISSGHLRAGDRLPSTRELMKLFDMNYNSTLKIINELCDKGIVEKIGGSGTYIKEKREASPTEKKLKLKLGVFLRRTNYDFAPGVYPTVLTGIQEAAAQNNTSILLHHISAKENLNEYVSEVAETCQSLILLGEYDTEVTELASSIPVVGTGMYNDYGASVSCLEMDPFIAADEASKFFKQQKKKHVDILTMPSPLFNKRIGIFANTWAESGGTSSIHIEAEFNDFDPQGAYLFASGSMLQGHSEKHYQKNGCTLSEYTTTLGFDGKHLLNPTYHNTASVTVDWHMAGRHAFEEAAYRANNPGTSARRILLPGTLLQKTTSKSA